MPKDHSLPGFLDAECCFAELGNGFEQEPWLEKSTSISLIHVREQARPGELASFVMVVKQTKDRDQTVESGVYYSMVRHE
jgi:hypothetical protein